MLADEQKVNIWVEKAISDAKKFCKGCQNQKTGQKCSCLLHCVLLPMRNPGYATATASQHMLHANPNNRTAHCLLN